MANEDVNIIIPERIQLKLFQNDCNNNLKIRVLVGSFYEALAQAYFGGERKVQQEALLKNLDYRACEPDIENVKHKKYTEVKASKSSNYFRLADWQLNKYFSFLNTKPGAELDFAFFAYNIKTISKECPTEDSLIEKLAENTDSLLIIPFSIVRNVWEKSKRHEESYHPAYSYFVKRDANMFLNEHENAFKKFGIHSEDFKVTKSIFPENFTIEGKKVNSFPVTKIENGNFLINRGEMQTRALSFK